MTHNNYKYCPFCGRKFPIFKSFEQRFCCFCGKRLKNQKKITKCTVCHKDVDSQGNHIIICSFCGSTYHYPCIYPWLLKYNSCPMCQNVFLKPNSIQRTRS